MEYAVRLTKDDNDTYLVTFPDIDGAVTYGATIDEALERAPDALATILEAYVKDRRAIPAPTTRKARHFVRVPALVAAKVLLYTAMQSGHVTKSELGRRLKWHPPQVDRLLAMKHASQLDQIESALTAVGKRLVIAIDDAPKVKAARPQRVAARR